MDFSRKRKMDFEEADRRYAELRRCYDAGAVGPEEFDAQLRQMMVRDAEGCWGAKSRRTGEWSYHDGQSWIRGIPPSEQREDCDVWPDSSRSPKP